MQQTATIETTNSAIEFIQNDGGREIAGYRGFASDCVVRAIAIAEGAQYADIYDELSALVKRKTRKASARDNVLDRVWMPYLKRLGYKRVDTFTPGKPKMKVRTEDMPEGETIILEMHRHLATVIDRKLHDTYDCSRDGERRVFGYWIKSVK